MPLATFRCPECANQTATRLNFHLRAAEGHEIMRPHPRCHNQPMTLIQIDYAH